MYFDSYLGWKDYIENLPSITSICGVQFFTVQ